MAKIGKPELVDLIQWVAIELGDKVNDEDATSMLEEWLAEMRRPR